MKKRINLATSDGWFLRHTLCQICPSKHHTFQATTITAALAMHKNIGYGDLIEAYDIHELCRYCYGTGTIPLAVGPAEWTA